ncbi:hypothetical protein SDC9_10031 [bioreactor metagenome]|uniref:DUF1848 domain-containing protein n=1 Tax=bioreactor metagenome TaxID=1076179 RepID=A0A644TC70_9ZZZZ|nr:DUF1848 domain-containing protein [Desulfitobacterium hafniense]MEA5021771.1 DUF1848 domain-containing protein [Desulfitobacterium hafniense]
MIISASRRTDIPAFYSQWLLNRLQEGYVLVPNPRNPSRYSRVELNPQVVDCLVFWTKNPSPMLSRLAEIAALGYPFYFQFTLTPYDGELEQNLPPKETLLNLFQKLSAMLGPERVVWRYDPVILTPELGLDLEYHLRQFERMAAALAGYTQRCIFSFLDMYPKVGRAMSLVLAQEAKEADETAMGRIAEGFSTIARKHDLELFTCCEPVELSQYGIKHASCIDQGMVEEILKCKIQVKKDPNQRPSCGCVESVEIGTYDSCPHGCLYCYGTSSSKTVRSNMACHDPKSPVLIGDLPRNAIITERKMCSRKDAQLTLF